MGFKMDYGGHDSIFEDNLVLSYPYDGQQCFTMDSFNGNNFTTNAHIVRRNRCFIGLGNKMSSGCGDPSCASPYPESKESLELIGTHRDTCTNGKLVLSSNKYFTPSGQGKIQLDDGLFTLKDAQTKCGMDTNSTVEKLPNEMQILESVKEMIREMNDNYRSMFSESRNPSTYN